MTLATDPKNQFDQAATFTMLGTPLLSQGGKQTLIARASQLWLHAKVYADGGERDLHQHENEDHAFFIVAGTAEFTTSDSQVRNLGPYEGMLIPRGVRYSFVSTGSEPLVILRIGAGENSELTSDGVVRASIPSDEQRSLNKTPVASGELFEGK